MIPRLTTNNEINKIIIDDKVIWLYFKDAIIMLENSGVKYFFSNCSKVPRSTFNMEAKKANSEQIGMIDMIK